MRFDYSWTVLATVLYCAGAAFAAPSTSKDEKSAIELINRGTELFQSGDYASAAIAFAKAHELLPDKANPYRWLGLTEAKLHHCTDANVYLEEFIRRVPGADPRTIEAISIRDQCRAELEKGILIVESKPPGAEVRLDDAEAAVVGVTPYRNDRMPPGAHVVFLSAAGHAPTSKSFTLQKQETVRLDVSLVRDAAAAAVSVSAHPSASSTLEPFPETSAPATPAGPSHTPGLLYAGVALLVVGAVVAVGGGIGFFEAASGAASTINSEAAARAPYDPSVDQSRQTYNLLTGVAAVSGAVIAVVGAALIGVGEHGREKTVARYTPRITPLLGTTVAGAALAGRF